MTSRRILILCPFPNGRAPSQRFRFEQYIASWERAGYEVVQSGFWDEAALSILYKPGRTVPKALGFLRGMVRQLRSVLGPNSYEHVFVHLGAMPAGPPLVEAICLLRKWRLVYDIDDAIFLGSSSWANPIARLLRSGAYVRALTRHADHVIAVNPFLVDWASKFNPKVDLIPTTIDPEYHRPPPVRTTASLPVLGWTGTFTTTVYLDIIRPALAKLQETHDFRFRVICDVDPRFPELAHYEFVHWKKETEIEDLWPIDVGLMPLTDLTVAKGKVGFKAIQFGALEIPSIVSDAGSGREVVDDERTGLVVPNTTEAWAAALARLIDDEALRRCLGQAARLKILDRYSVPAQQNAYLRLFSP